MAPGLGPFVRMLAQAAVPLFRAFATAYQQALHNARKEGATAAKEALKPKRGAMTPAEAAEILHLPEGGAAGPANLAAAGGACSCLVRASRSKWCGGGRARR